MLVHPTRVKKYFKEAFIKLLERIPDRDEPAVRALGHHDRHRELQHAHQQRVHRPEGVERRSEVSLIVPDFTISVCGSSCNSLFFGLILFSYLIIYLFLGLPSCFGNDIT